MKKFNASDLSKKPRELFMSARQEGAIIQHKDRQGIVTEEFILIPNQKRYIEWLIKYHNN